MNKLQNQIMEIIEPYTDKTLSEGCWFEWDEWSIVKIKNEDELWEDLRCDWMEVWYDFYYDDVTVCKILGHYDITAVLKYVDKKWWEIDYNSWINLYMIWEDYADVINFTELPEWKPLHLYSEQENKDLLKLFEKLWT